MKNKILAIEAAPEAIPPKPKIAAIIATIRKITVQRNIVFEFRLRKYFLEFLLIGYKILCHKSNWSQVVF